MKARYGENPYLQIRRVACVCFFFVFVFFVCFFFSVFLLRLSARNFMFSTWFLYENLSQGKLFSTRLHVRLVKDSDEHAFSRILIRRRSAYAKTQSDQSLHYPPEDAFDPCRPTECPAKTLIRLRGCAV